MESTPQPPGPTIPTPPAQPIHQKITRGHSCILCQQRKVRCDRQKPQCSNCVKAHAECIPSTPAAPRRRRRKLSELDVAARLRKYEHLLRVNGIRIDDDGVTGGVGSANASGTEDGNADESISSRQEKTPNPNPQTLSIANKGKDPITTTATGTENDDNHHGPHEHRCNHNSHELHGHRSMGCARGSKAGRGRLYSKHGNSRYIEKWVALVELLLPD